MPINKVTATYRYVSEYANHTVQFKCIENEEKWCFIENGTDQNLGTTAISISFKTKEQCYKWIELFAKVKVEINKE